MAMEMSETERRRIMQIAMNQRVEMSFTWAPHRPPLIFTPHYIAASNWTALRLLKDYANDPGDFWHTGPCKMVYCQKISEYCPRRYGDLPLVLFHQHYDGVEGTPIIDPSGKLVPRRVGFKRVLADLKDQIHHVRFGWVLGELEAKAGDIQRKHLKRSPAK